MKIRYSRRKLHRVGVSALALGLAFGAPGAPLLTTAAQAQSNAPIQVLVDGRAINFQGAQPTQTNGRVLVPLRGVFEALGATVDYDAQTNTALASRGSTQVQLRIGSTQAFVNGQLKTLDVPAQTRLGRTLVPLRFVLEALGVPVQWDGANRNVLISSGGTSGGNTGGNTGGGTVTPPINDGGYIPPQPGDSSLNATVVSTDANGTAITLRDSNGQARNYYLTPGARVYRQTTGLISAGATPRFSGSVLLADTSRLVPGEEVSFRVNGNNEITDLTAQSSLITARVLSAQNGRIVLDDGRNTTLNIGANLRFVDASGRASSVANLQRGDNVALFITPTQRRIYQVSALRDDLNAANGTGYTDTNYPPTTGGNQGGEGAPNITLVQHNATRPLRAGATVSVTVRGTPRLTGTFNIVPDGSEFPLEEDSNRPGVYTGTYVVRNNDNVLNGRVTAYLRDAQGRESLVQSQAPITIDTTPPRITSTSPQSDAQLDNDQPNITVNATDLGGSGIASADVTINGQRVSDDRITVSPNAVRFTPDAPLRGRSDVRVTVRDGAGNQASTSFSFDVGNNGGNNGGGIGTTISSLSHNATRALTPGDRVTVSMNASPGGRATFSVIGDSGRVVRSNIPMTEDRSGRYLGSYTIPNNLDDSELLIRGRFVDDNGQTSTADAASSVLLAGGTGIGGVGDNAVNITSPTEGTQIDTPLIVRGTAAPRSTVEISVRAEGVRYLFFDYRQEIGGTHQVQANNRGNWTSDPVDLPQPRNVSGLRYVITAVQIDAAGRRSEPVTVTVNARN